MEMDNCKEVGHVCTLLCAFGWSLDEHDEQHNHDLFRYVKPTIHLVKFLSLCTLWTNSTDLLTWHEPFWSYYQLTWIQHKVFLRLHYLDVDWYLIWSFFFHIIGYYFCRVSQSGPSLSLISLLRKNFLNSILETRYSFLFEIHFSSNYTSMSEFISWPFCRILPVMEGMIYTFQFCYPILCLQYDNRIVPFWPVGRIYQ